MPDDDLKILGDRIRDLRKKHGLTQEDLAANAGIDRSYIGGVERGERNVTFYMLATICLALECDIPFLTKGLPRVSK